MEIPANFEFIKASASLINTGAGMQLHSVKSTKPDSFRMYARSRYGNDWFGYPFFDDRGPSVFKRLIFRNSGNDNVNKKSTNCHFRDPLAEEIALISNKNGMVSASRPVNVYLNGKYYGVFNLRERIDEYFIETHTGIDEDYDLLERSFGYPKNRNAIVGSFEKWDQLLSFVDTTGDMTKQDDYNYVKSQVDIVNFTDYWITEVFLGNYDWLSNNIKFWKPEDGKWQWIYWDLDHSLGLIYGSYGDPAWNTLQWSLTFSDRAWPNGYNNILIRGLLKNQEYRDYFIKRFTCLLNTNYTDKQTVPIFESFVDIYENDLPMHMDRWNRNISDWENANTILADYLQKRPGYVFGHLQSFFGLDNPVNVSLRFEPPGSGYLFFNDTEKTGDLLEGKYFPGMKYPVSFEVHDDLSLYRFMVNNKSFSSDSILLTEDTEIRVNFLREDATIPVQISEIYFNNREEYDCGDWIEFYYYGFDTLDLSGAELRADDSHILFSFPQGTNIPPSSYFVLAEDEQMFSKIYTDDFIYLNGLTDEMDEMDEMTLISGNGQVLKTMDLGELQEMTMAPGQGYSLEMNRLGLDQDQKINWSLSGDSYGSPGLSNDSTWNFHRPAGKDRYFRIEDEVLIEFASSDFYYSDQDNHRMAGFYVKDILGHATFQHDNIILEKDHFYEPMDFWYIPSQNSNSATRLTYTFIDQSGQSSEINTLTFSYVSQRTEETEATFRIYPNPASDFLYIEGVPDPENIRQYTITDLTGRTIKSGSIDQYKEMFSIEINGLPAGIYFLGIRCSGAVYENKFIINR